VPDKNLWGSPEAVEDPGAHTVEGVVLGDVAVEGCQFTCLALLRVQESFRAGYGRRVHQRRRREQLAVVLRSLHGELHQEVFVHAPEDIAPGRAQRLAMD
jgi:hypothetical protein